MDANGVLLIRFGKRRKKTRGLKKDKRVTARPHLFPPRQVTFEVEKKTAKTWLRSLSNRFQRDKKLRENEPHLLQSPRAGDERYEGERARYGGVVGRVGCRFGVAKK